MATVYLITSGSYSDYHVDWVTLDKAVADATAAADPSLNVEEHELITEAPQHTELLVISCELDRMGVISESVHEYLTWATDEKPVEVRWDRNRDIGQFNSDYRRSERSICIAGTDHERVRKVLSDRRAKALVELAEFAQHPRDHICKHGKRPTLKREAEGIVSFEFDCPTPYECQLEAYQRQAPHPRGHVFTFDPGL
jgi:hypothetical protein